MVSIHDFPLTLATIIGAEVPKDRPFDSVDRSAFCMEHRKSLEKYPNPKPVSRTQFGR
ncbi:MAG: hypothetical protein ACREIS_04510 [Nitrospiraceae bacterium]